MFLIRRLRATFITPLGALVLVLASGCAPVLDATQHRNMAKLKQVLADGASPNRTRGGMTPLVSAIEGDSLDFVEVLVEAGADINYRLAYTHNGGTYADGLTPLQIAALHGSANSARYLLAKGADPYVMSGVTNIMILIARNKRPAGNGVTGEVLDHLERTGGRKRMLAFATAQTGLDWTPLSAAAYFGDVDMVRQLLARGLDPNKLSPAKPIGVEKGGLLPELDAWRPLHFALRNEQVAAARTLIAGGADPRLGTRDGRTTERIASMLGNEREWNAFLENNNRALEREERQQREATANNFRANQAATLATANKEMDERVARSRAQLDAAIAAASRSGPRPDAEVRPRPEAQIRPEAARGLSPAPARAESPPTVVSAPAAATSHPAEQLPAYTPPTRLGDCVEKSISGLASGSESKSREQAEAYTQRAAERMCIGLGVGSVTDLDCHERQRARMEIGKAGPFLNGADTFHQCTVQVACAKPRLVCKAGPAGGSRQ